MGPEFRSDIFGDGPEYGDVQRSDHTSSDGDSDSVSSSSNDPIKDNKRVQKKRNVRLLQKCRHKLTPEARRKELQSRKKKRREMGPEARRKDLEFQNMKRKGMGPEVCRKDLESQITKR